MPGSFPLGERKEKYLAKVCIQSVLRIKCLLDGENKTIRGRENFRSNRLRKLLTNTQNQNTKPLQTQHTPLNFHNTIYTRKKKKAGNKLSKKLIFNGVEMESPKSTESPMKVAS